MDGDDFFPAGTPLSPASPPFSEHDWENGGGVFLPFFQTVGLKSGDVGL